MFSSLQKRWNVSKKDFVVILCVFAITGFTTAFLSRSVPVWIGVSSSSHWLPKLLLRLAVLIFGYQLVLLLVAFLLGQFSFFWQFEKKGLQKLGVLKTEKVAVVNKNIAQANETNNTKPKQIMSTINIAIFASGTGTNAQKLIDYFRTSSRVRVSLVICNKPGAGVLTIAVNEAIPTLLIEKENFFRGDAYLPHLQNAAIDFVVLAGFLWKIPQALINAYPRRIVNIHPALLPKFGGKGMYGQYVHEAVLQAGERESGITIHYVDEQYDSGDIIFQTACPILESDTPESIAARIHQLEHLHYPKVVEEVVMNFEQLNKE